MHDRRRRTTILYFASARDAADYTVGSKMYYQSSEMQFCTGFIPRIEHFPRDSFPVPPPPEGPCGCVVPPPGENR